jgi:GNAT superfamily N-acetyltransferase
MPLAVRLTTDPAPALAPIAGVTYTRVLDAATMAAAQRRPLADIERRMADGHRAWAAWRDDTIVAWGWVATQHAELGELQFRFIIPEGDRYLWNFVTVPSARGQGLYPRLLDAILQAEGREASRFWIAWAPENHASGSGIVRAGFSPVAELSFDDARRPAVRAIAPGGAALAARLLGLPEAAAPLARCWRCVRSAAHGGRPCARGMCRCDYQRPEQGCAA